MKKLIFATNNAHKLEEVGAIIGSSLQLVTLREAGITEDIPENEPTIEGTGIFFYILKTRPRINQI